jgi:hypothetical protein
MPATPAPGECAGADDVESCYTALLLDQRAALIRHVQLVERLCR